MTRRFARVRAELRPYRWIAVALVAYAILRVVFAHVMRGDGLLTPSGAPNKALAAFALGMLAARLAVLVVVPVLVVYRLVGRLVELVAGRCGRGRP